MISRWSTSPIGRKAAHAMMVGAVLLVLPFFPSSLLLAEPVLPGLFSDHMVMQQGREVPVWGWADPGERIKVDLGGTIRSVVAGNDQRWKVALPAMPAGGPFLLTIEGKKTVSIKDLMVGEVWVLSGQSNMTLALSGAAHADSEIPAANYPLIRLFTVPQKSSLQPQNNVTAHWKICTPETAKEFSAVAYFFGRELYKELGIPIGLIHSSWPGTAAEDWSSAESLRGDPELEPILQRWAAASQESKRLATHPASFNLEFDDFELLKPSDSSAEPLPFSNFDEGNAGNSLNGLWTYDWQAAPNTVFELTRPGYDGSGYAARLSGQIDAADASLLKSSLSPNGAAASLAAYAGVRFRYRGQGWFRFRSMQPSIYDFDDYTSKVFTAAPTWQSAIVWFKDLKQAGWGVPESFTPDPLSGFAVEVLRAPGFVTPAPSGLFNGMIAPLIPFSIRGAAWYQGEGNAPRAYQYRRLLPALIRGWRQSWGEGDFPFLIVQLPNYGSPDSDPSDSAWAELREAQLMALQLPDTGLAVTIDLGEANNVHPPRKQEVGRRLALWALGTTYRKDLVYSGPVYETMQTEGHRIRIRFRHVGHGLQAQGGNLRGFAIAGADKKFIWGDAQIDRDSVLVSSPEVGAPIAVRYGWAGNPDCSLYNKDGLPASPFRTDDWPASTINAK